MKRSLRNRIVCLATILLTLFAAASAKADLIGTDGPVSLYTSMDANSRTGLVAKIDPAQNSTNQGGWYQVKVGGTNYYVRAVDVAQREPEVTPSPTPTASPSPSPTPTLKPGETAQPTASPTPGIIGEQDSTYEGTILSYVVPTGGLWLYDAPGGSQKVNVAAGVTVKLNDSATSGWYTTVYNGSVYYVPTSLTSYSNPNETPAPANIKSITLNANVNLYSAYNSSTHTLSGETGSTLTKDTRVNVKHVQSYLENGIYHDIYAYTVTTTASGTTTTKTYYFDGSGMEKSGATIIGNEDAEMVLQIKAVADTRLYLTQKKDTNFIKLPTTQAEYTLYGQKIDSDWYKVTFQSKTYYLLITDTYSTEQIVIGGEGNTNTFYVTAGSGGASIYTSRAMTGGVPSGGTYGQRIAAGQSVLASVYDSNWYTYVVVDGTKEVTYYLFVKDFSSSASTTNVTGLKVFFPDGTQLYDRTDATRASSYTLSAGYYMVQSLDSGWYSIIYDSKTYYIKKAEVATNAGTQVITIYGDSVTTPQIALSLNQSIQVLATLSADGLTYSFTYSNIAYTISVNDLIGGASAVETPIGATGEGKTYSIAIGVSGGTLYMDAACTTPATLRLTAGELISATRYSSSLYIVSIDGAKYYLPVGYVASVKDGDDASLGGQTSTQEPISDIVVGEVNTNYATEVISYVIPKGGLWLYRAKNAASAAVSLNEGTTVKLNISDDASWYTTWYGGVQYYVPKGALSVSDTGLNTTTTYSIQLSATVTLYSDSGLKTLASKTLAAGARVNVRAVRLNTDKTVAVYSYAHADGKTYYFAGGSSTVDPTSIMTATVASNTDTSLITSITLNENVWVYSSPSTTSSSVKLKSGDVVYGVSYNTEWYKIIYNNGVWYMKKSADVDTEQITVTNDAGSTTYTVVIAEGGAKAYSLPSTNADGTLNYVKTLAAGSAVAASKYDTTWYTYADGGQTLYFRNTTVVNVNSNEAIRSYRLVLTQTVLDAAGKSDGLTLYPTISEVNTPLKSPKLDPGTYVLRQINSQWSSVVLGNVTYYVKNADIPSDSKAESTPIASTTVGNSYRITIGSAAPVFASENLSGTAYANAAPGTQTTGLKLYVAGAVGNGGNKDGLVYRISYGGRTGYISAAYVTGIYEGDEVLEAQKAAEEAQKNESEGGYVSQVPIGSTPIETLNAGTVLYSQKSTTSTSTALPTQTTLRIEKVDANWYSVQYMGITYYIPLATIEPEAAAGGSSAGQRVVVNVGETYTYMFAKETTVYKTPDGAAAAYRAVAAGTQYPLTKISETWYQMKLGEEIVYVKVADVVLPLVTTPPTTNTTSDGTAYITAMLLINPTTGSVNLRKTASLSGTKLDRIPKGTQVRNNSYTVDSNKKVWYNVTYNGRTGYVLGDFVEPVGSGNTGSTAADPSLDVGRALTVNAVNVNVRTGAGPGFSTIGKMAKNSVVVPLDYKVGTDNLVWYKFQYSSSTTGYIRSDYLDGSVASTTEQSGNVAIKVGGTNLRSGPGDSFNVVTQLTRDTIVTILGTGTDSKDVLWYRITIGGTSGYVRSDLVRPLTAAEQSALLGSVTTQYTELKSGSKGDAVLALQQQLIKLGYLTAGSADGIYGTLTVNAVKAYQTAKGFSANGIASPGVQAAIFNTTNITPGSTQSLDWFTAGYALINANKSISVFDIQSQITWNATYINGANHADIVPASKAEADKLTAYDITGSSVRRPVIVTIAGQKFAGSMYAVGHGSTSYVSYFTGVMCIHFTNSKTHGTGNVDKDHQNAINAALQYANGQ